MDRIFRAATLRDTIFQFWLRQGNAGVHLRVLYFIRFLIPGLFLRVDSRLRMDLDRWKEIHHLTGTDLEAMAALLWRKKEFRNLVLYRCRRRKLYTRLFRLFYPPMETIYFDAYEIGGGL